jgi:hypothetical protein
MEVDAHIVREGAIGDAARERTGDLSFYDTYDSPAQSFDDYFAEVLTPYRTLREYVEAHYGSNKGEGTAVEFGGPGRKLFADLNDKKLFRRTAGFVLHDPRNNLERQMDVARGHDVIEADVFFDEGAAGLSWRTVEEWIRKNGRPLFTVERMVQGIDLVRRADLYMHFTQQWLSQLPESGTLLAEISKKMPFEERKKVVTAVRALDIHKANFREDMAGMLIRV